MTIFQEELLETFARSIRFKEGFKKIKKDSNLSILDLGCGPRCFFYHFLQQNHLPIKNYIGIDSLIKDEKGEFFLFKNIKKVKLIKEELVDKIYLPDQSVNYVVGFAFLEHLNHPDKILAESVRVLKKGGRAIFTAPTPLAKIILELFLSRINLISCREIAEHKYYFNKDSLLNLTKTISVDIKVEHSYFEFGLNNLLVITKR